MAIASFDNAAPPSGAVVFEPAVFSEQYPEFAPLSGPTLQLYFDQATFVLSNSRGTRVRDPRQREVLLYLLTAHIAALMARGSDGLVGRIKEAQEGSVSAKAEFSTRVAEVQAWFVQTQYGATYWQMTASYRTMIYLRSGRRCG